MEPSFYRINSDRILFQKISCHLLQSNLYLFYSLNSVFFLLHERVLVWEEVEERDSSYFFRRNCYALNAWYYGASFPENHDGMSDSFYPSVWICFFFPLHFYSIHDWSSFCRNLPDYLRSPPLIYSILLLPEIREKRKDVIFWTFFWEKTMILFLLGFPRVPPHALMNFPPACE